MIVHSQFRQTGYLFNDNRASGGTVEEADVTTCAHCQRILLKKHQTFEGAWCGRCGAPVCHQGPCAARTEARGCLAFIAQVELALTRQYHQQQNARILGI